MTELEQKFQQTLDDVKNVAIDFKPNNTEKLKLYAFFKQATIGNVQGDCPGMTNLIERAKWNAWNAIKNMSKEDAMTGYLAVFGR